MAALAAAGDGFAFRIALGAGAEAARAAGMEGAAAGRRDGIGKAAAQAQRRGGRRGGVSAARFGWLSRLERGKAEAKKTGKPLMVVLRCEP